jgi:hypothetical protein
MPGGSVTGLGGSLPFSLLDHGNEGCVREVVQLPFSDGRLSADTVGFTDPGLTAEAKAEEVGETYGHRGAEQQEKE